MRLRLFARRIVPLVAIIAAVRCGNDFTPPNDLLPASISLLGGNQQSGVVGQLLSDTLVVRVTDLKDRPVQDQRVLFKLTAGGGGATLIPDTAVTDADGQAKSVWVLGQLAGQQSVEARVLSAGVSGGLIATFYGQAAADAPDTVFAIRGQNQQGIVGTALAESLIVVVGDQFGNPIAGQTVNWTVPNGQGSVSASTTTTGPNGRSAVRRILGGTAGPQAATATWTTLPGSPVVFTHTAGASGVSALVKLFGDNPPQTAPAGQRLTDSIVVRAQDASGNGVAGRSVLWVVSGGGGSISAGSTTTDAQGKTFVTWTLGTTAGENTVTAAITGLTPVTFTAFGTASQPTRIQAASSTSLSAPNSTPVFPPPSVRVNDANNNGVQGVTITFQVTAGGGTVSDPQGSGSVVTVATGATGTATLTTWVLGPTAGVNNNTVTATATGTGITGNPVTFTATAVAGQPARLAFAQQPINTGAGVVITPAVTVQVQDLGGNLVVGATNPITVAFNANPGSGTLGGTKTVNAIGGVATFDDLTIDKTGTGYTLATSALGLAPATSNAFNITPGPAFKLGFIVQPSNPGAGQPMAPPVQVAVQDQFGNTVPTATNSITVAFGNNPTPGAVLSGTKIVSAIAGVATFPGLSVNLSGVGYTMTATATNLTTATSAPFNIGFGAATRLAFIQQPSSVQAGAAMAPEVQVAIQDANGNTVATANDSVFLAIGVNPGGSTLSGARVMAVAGVAHFGALVINLAGNGYTLVTSSGTLAGATSNAFNVTPGSGQRLEFGQHPTQVAAGATIAPPVTVRMLDINGNVVSNFVGPITVALGSNPSAGVLSGTLTQNAFAGVATFNNLSINKVGNLYSLIGTGAAQTAISNAFNVIAGAPVALVFDEQPPTIIPAVAGQAITPPVTVMVVDLGGNQVLTSIIPVTMSIFTNPGGSTLTGGTTVTVNAVGGLATFSNLILNKAGTGYVLRASSGTLTPGNSVAFNVRANDPARLVFGQEPTSAVAGALITPTVTVRVEDNFGNLSDVNGNVALSIVNNPGGASFPGGSNSVIPTNGIASFPNISLNKTGNAYTIRAGITGLVPDTSVAFNITPGAATKLVFGIQPLNAVAGVAITPAVTVRVLDVNDNLVNSTAPVTLVISTNPGAATLTGGGPINAAAGTATFAGLSLNRSGVGYALTATSGTLAAATSLNFNITHGAASVLVWTVQPTNATAGSAIGPAPQVTVRDNLGNTVTSFAGSITVTIGNNPGVPPAILTGGTPSNLNNGVADFAVMALNRPGTGYTLIASAGGVPPNATSAAFNVVAGSGNQLAFIAQPTRDTVGKPMTPAVQVAVQDAQGNTVTTATDAITLSLVINGEGAVLTGNTANAVAGIATFSNLRLDKATINGYNMVATAAGLISSPNSSLFLIDRAPTTTTVTADTPDPSVVGQPYTVNFTTIATAPASGTPTGSVTVSDGVSSCLGALTAGAGSCSLTSTTAGAKTLTGTYTGDANYAPLTAVTAAHTVNPAATTTTITADTPDPSTVGVAYSVTYTVTANAPGAGTPTGNVTVSDGAATCVGTVATGTCNITSTTTGAKTLTATYATDGNFAGSVSAGAAHTVNAGGTITTIGTHTPDPSTIGQGITVNFTVTGGATTPTGTVTVTDGTVTCPAGTLTAGAGSCLLTPTTGGVKTLVANYSGDATHTGGFSAGVTHTVNLAATVTTVSADTPDPSVVGQPYTVTVTVTGGATTPTGTVSVSDGSQTCPVTLGGGTGNCQLTSITVGGKNLVGTYGGDATHAGSVSAGAPHTVNAASTLATITSDTPDPSNAGVAYTVNFTVAAVAPGAGTPTGTVTVSDGTGATCPGTLSGGAGSCQLTSTTPGAKTLVATYATDGNFATSPPSAGAAHTVNAAGTTVVINSDTPEPSVVGQPYTVSVTVSGGATTPTGIVTVADGSGQTCPITLSGGTGSCPLTSTTVGSKTLVANYPGDATHATGVSAGTPHQVNQAVTAVTISADTPDPSVVGQAVTVTYAVAVVAPGAGTPTGTVTVSDGVASCIGTLPAVSCPLSPSTAGVKSLTANYSGDLNFAGDGSPGVAHTVNAATTTTTINGDTPDPSTVNQAYTVTYTVAVTAPGAGTPTGNVTVSDGTGPICTGTAAAGQCAITSTTTGTKTLNATYLGDANFNTSSTLVGTSHVVNAGGTTTTISSDTPDPSVVGQQITVNFTVTGAPGTPTGTVTVSDGTISCGPVTLNGAGTGSCPLTFTTAGNHNLVATYSGDGTHGGSFSTPATTHQVNAAATTTTITGDTPDPSIVNVAYTVNYSVAVNSPGAGIPTGNVTVSDGTAQNTCTVAAGTCQLTSTTTGTKTLTATYAGDGSNFAASPPSAGMPHTVNGIATSTAVGSSQNPSTFGTAVTWTATVTGTGTPTGSVQFQVDATNFGSPVTLNGAGQAAITSSATLAAGNHSVTANYTATGNFVSSNGSLGGGQTVNQASSSTGVVSTDNTSLFGQSVTFTATVSAGAGTPTGNVQFVVDGSNFGGTVALSGGQASTNTSALAVGDHTVVANYLGSTNFLASGGSLGGGQNVAQAQTTTAINNITPGTSQAGNPITVNWSVALVAPGAGTPTGTVSVSDGIDGCSAPVGDGSCVYTPSAGPGTIQVTATYGGDTNFAGSGSTAVGHTIN